ncbi:MAG: class I adenylate-forming enzyme family protein [Burkholderiaceae bacterium]
MANVYQAIAWHAQRTPDAVAVRDTRRSLSYAAFVDHVHAVAERLAAAGVRRGMRVAVVADTSIEYIALYYATAILGFVLVPINIRYGAVELQYVLGDADPALVLTEAERRTEIAAATRAPLLDVEDLRPTPGAAGRDAWRRSLGFVAYRYGSVSETDTAVIMYTSGTTGSPKGAMISHGNLLWNCVNYVQESGYGPAVRSLLAVPMFHAVGFGSVAGPTLHGGGTVCVIDRFSPAAVIAAIDRERPSHLFLIAAMWVQMTDDAQFRSRSFDGVSVVSTGAGLLGHDRQLQIRARFPGAQFGCGYGMTESFVTTLKSQSSAELDEHQGSPGFIWRLIDYRLVDESGQVLDDLRGPGELQVRGPMVFQGYWRDEEKTKSAFTDDGWLRTGDLFRFDDDGYGHLVGRVKDMIKTGGENVAAREVEDCLASYPGVREAAAFGRQHDMLGEELCAAVELDLDPARIDATGIDPANVDAAAFEADIRAFCRTRLSSFKVPRRVFIVDRLPRSTSDKVQKFILRERFRAA